MSTTIGSADASQRLAYLLAQLRATQTATANTPSSASASSSAASNGIQATPSDNCLTGSAAPSLSGEVLMTLMQLQGDAGANASATPSASGGAAADPLQALFTAMDADGNGSVSESETETYIQNAGGTKDQADALYAALDPNGGDGITQSQMASALPSSPPQGGGHHHHHHHHIQNGSGGAAGTLMSLLDTNQDGSVSQDELTSFVTANGGTAQQATSDFSALDMSGAGALTSADFATAWEKLQQSQGGSFAGSMAVSLLDAFATNNGTATPTNSVTA